MLRAASLKYTFENSVLFLFFFTNFLSFHKVIIAGQKRFLFLISCLNMPELQRSFSFQFSIHIFVVDVVALSFETKMRLPVAAFANGRLEFRCAFNIYHVPIDNNDCAPGRTECCHTLFCLASFSNDDDDDKNEISASCAFLRNKIPVRNYPPSIGINSDAQKQPCVLDGKYVIEKNNK